MKTRRQWPHRLFAACAASALSLLPACGPASVDHTPTGNILDPDTQSLEESIGHWQPWYSTDVARSTAGAQRGLASLQIEVTAPFGWGVQLDNWPGFPAAPGRHRAELWARAVSGSALELIVSVRARDDSGDLESRALRLRLDRSWRKLGGDFMAPPGTTRIAIELTGVEGKPGDAIQVDEIFVL
jgi:hypothetical protein